MARIKNADGPEEPTRFPIATASNTSTGLPTATSDEDAGQIATVPDTDPELNISALDTDPELNPSAPDTDPELNTSAPDTDPELNTSASDTSIGMNDRIIDTELELNLIASENSRVQVALTPDVDSEIQEVVPPFVGSLVDLVTAIAGNEVEVCASHVVLNIELQTEIEEVTTSGAGSEMDKATTSGASSEIDKATTSGAGSELQEATSSGSKKRRARACTSAGNVSPKRLRSTTRKEAELLRSTTEKAAEPQKPGTSRRPARVNGFEVSELCQAKYLADGRFRFVYDLFKTAKQYKNPRFVDENLPNPERFCIFFEEHHKAAVKSYLKNQGKNFADLIAVLAPEADMEAFRSCLEKFEQEYKPEEYSENGFVIYCSAIAFLGNYFSEKGNLEAWEAAFQYVFNLLCGALEKSKYELDLAESSW